MQCCQSNATCSSDFSRLVNRSRTLTTEINIGCFKIDIMDLADRIRLQRSHTQLREQVTFKYIAAFLLRDQVISVDELEMITSQPTKQAQMDILIGLLELREAPDTFDLFLSSLREDYSWLAEDLENHTISARDVEKFKALTLMKEQENQQNQKNIKCPKKEIGMEVIKMLQQNARLVRRWSALAYQLGLERQAQSIRVRVNINCEDLDQCLFYLVHEWVAAKPTEANLANLIKALEAEEFNDVAHQLEARFC